MKYLLPLVLLCMLLCGCDENLSPEEGAPISPTESVIGAVSEPTEFGGAVRTVPLNLPSVQGVRLFNGNFLLISGPEHSTLTLLDRQSLETLASATVDFPLDAEDPSLILHRDGSLSFFDPVAGETVLLDQNLQTVTRFPLPGALQGRPILSEDGMTLFYCTASHIRAWDLQSGIHRCVKEMASPGQSLEAVHGNGTLLQCHTAEGETLFLSGADGTLLHRIPGELSLTFAGGSYFLFLPAGPYRIPVFGTDPLSPRMLSSPDLKAPVFFLPELSAAVWAVSSQLVLCNLSDGRPVSCLPWPDLPYPRAVLSPDRNTLVILTCDPGTDLSFLHLWDLSQSNAPVPENLRFRIFSYGTDAAGLEQCRQQAQKLGSRYGIRILLEDEALVSQSSALSVTAEHLVPVLQQELLNLEQRLSHFPLSLLQDTAARFSSLNLCLVRSPEKPDTIGTAASGAHFLDGQDAYLILPTGDSGQALYHQLYHLMDIHILSNSKILDQWNDQNPAGFHYDYDYAANARRDSGIYLFQDSRVFVDTFSMSFPKEDRARILEYAMLPEMDSLFRPVGMQAKLQLLCRSIRDAYGLTEQDGPFLWEQYLE